MFPSPTGLYKALDPDRKPHHGGHGRAYVVGKRRSVKGELVACVNGLHACTLEQLPRWLGPAIHPILEASEERLVYDDKIVLRSVVIGPAYATWNERTARLFAADCAERVLPIYERAYPDDDRLRKAIEAARRFANGEIGRDDLAAAQAAAGDAAGAAARAAAWAAAGDAAWAAAQAAAWDAAWAAAWDAAWAAAGDAAWAAAWAAARDAAWDAERVWQAERLGAYLSGAV